jgi:hypothetical protein
MHEWTTRRGGAVLVGGLAVGALGSYFDDLLGTSNGVLLLQMILWAVGSLLIVAGIVTAITQRAGTAAEHASRADAHEQTALEHDRETDREAALGA